MPDKRRDDERMRPDDMDELTPAERTARARVADADVPDDALPVAPVDPPTTLTPQFEPPPPPVGPGPHVGAYPQDPAVQAEAIRAADEAAAARDDDEPDSKPSESIFDADLLKPNRPNSTPKKD